VYAITIDDTVDEPDETIDVTIGSSETVSPGSPSTGTVTLQDDDPSPVVRFTSSTAAVSEGAEQLEVTAELTFASQRTLTISYATADDTTSAGDDYTAVAGTLTFAPGVTSQSFSIPLTIDCVEEDTEYFSVALSAPGNLSVGSPGTQVITLLDEGDCTPSEVTFTSPVMVLSESGTWNIPVERRGGSQGRLSVSIQPTYYSAISPEDFTLAETTLVWENGEAGIKEVPVSIIPDTTQEVDERFFLRIEDVTAQAMPEVGPLSWMGLIIRDDDPGGLGTRRYEPAGWGDDDPVAGDDPAGAGDRRLPLSLASTLTWNDPLPRSENYTLWRYDVFTGWRASMTRLDQTTPRPTSTPTIRSQTTPSTSIESRTGTTSVTTLSYLHSSPRRRRHEILPHDPCIAFCCRPELGR
jgi:hypothetical protein